MPTPPFPPPPPPPTPPPPKKKEKIKLMKHKSYESGMFNQMTTIFAAYFLHILQGQASDFHTLISLLNSCKDLQFLII